MEHYSSEILKPKTVSQILQKLSSRTLKQTKVACGKTEEDYFLDFWSRMRDRKTLTEMEKGGTG